jgi:amino acid transporter
MTKKQKTRRQKKFNAFNGVFVPTFLSIIGVVLFLRLGFVVGNAGIIPTILIILLSATVTVATALSLSSITTNLKIEAGGAYPIIKKTLGLEVGGSVGIPLALAQIFSVVFYIFGFAEAWTFIFPGHPFLLVVYIVLGSLLLLNIISVKIAIRAQMLVFGLIVVSLVVLFMGGGDWWNNFGSAHLITDDAWPSFWWLFALFFPAMTGLQAGIGLSGELTDPKRQIGKGVLWAIGLTTLIYIAVAFWLGVVATNQELLNNNLIMVDKAFYGPIILAGILAATFSSGLTTFVASPRLMNAMSKSKILPLSNLFEKETKKGEPYIAILFTTFVILIALTLGSLNSIAPLLTMFFLITYALINISVFIEQSLGMVSFRPRIKVPKFVALYGFVASIVFMFVINTIAGLIAFIFLIAVYAWLVKRKLEAKEGDLRSGLFVTLAEWAAKKIIKLPESTKHTWKPNILVPVVLTRTLLGNFPLIKAIGYPTGTMTVLGIKLEEKKKVPDADNLTTKEIKEELRELPEMVKKFSKEGLFTSYSIVETHEYSKAVILSVEAISSQVFHPNILFLPFKSDRMSETHLEKIFDKCLEQKIGVVLFHRDKEAGLGSEKDIHVWISPKVIKEEFRDDRKFDLGMLLAYQLYRNWSGKLNLWMCVDEKDTDKARYYLQKLIYEARFPNETNINISTKPLESTVNQAPQGDIHIVAVSKEDIKLIQDLPKNKNKSFLFVADSTNEDVLA